MNPNSSINYSFKKLILKWSHVIRIWNRIQQNILSLCFPESRYCSRQYLRNNSKRRKLIWTYMFSCLVYIYGVCVSFEISRYRSVKWRKLKHSITNHGDSQPLWHVFLTAAAATNFMFVNVTTTVPDIVFTIL